MIIRERKYKQRKKKLLQQKQHSFIFATQIQAIVALELADAEFLM